MQSKTSAVAFDLTYKRRATLKEVAFLDIKFVDSATLCQSNLETPHSFWHILICSTLHIKQKRHASNY
jgi:hypothetical protein